MFSRGRTDTVTLDDELSHRDDDVSRGRADTGYRVEGSDHFVHVGTIFNYIN